MRIKNHKQLQLLLSRGKATVKPSGEPARSKPAQHARKASNRLQRAKAPDEIAFPLIIRIPGEPIPKARARVVSDGEGGTRSYTPEETAAYERLVEHHGRIAMGKAKPLDIPLDVAVIIYRGIPESMTDRERVMAISGELRPDTKPDADNYEKAILDGLESAVWINDSRIVDLTVRKFWSEEPRAVVIVRRASLRKAPEMEGI